MYGTQMNEETMAYVTFSPRGKFRSTRSTSTTSQDFQPSSDGGGQGPSRDGRAQGTDSIRQEDDGVPTETREKLKAARGKWVVEQGQLGFVEP